MSRIRIVNWGEKIVEVKDFSKTLLTHFHENHLDWMHACGGKGRCTTCKAIIVSGMENLEDLTPAEERYRGQGALRANERLCCQAIVKGDISLQVPEEYKLPHIHYGAGAD